MAAKKAAKGKKPVAKKAVGKKPAPAKAKPVPTKAAAKAKTVPAKTVKPAAAKAVPKPAPAKAIPKPAPAKAVPKPAPPKAAPKPAPAKVAPKPAPAKVAAKPAVAPVAKPAAVPTTKPTAKPVPKAVAAAKPVAGAKPAAATKPAPAATAKPAAAPAKPSPSTLGMIRPGMPQKVVTTSSRPVVARPASADGEDDGLESLSLLSGPRNVKPYLAKKGEQYMNKGQLEHFRTILATWKRDLMEEVDRTVTHMKDEAANPPDPNDRATLESEFSLELRTRDRERKLIRKIDEALSRIDDGSYGYCLETGEEIGVKRLEARPVATLSIEAQERRERREKQYGDRDDRYR